MNRRTDNGYKEGSMHGKIMLLLNTFTIWGSDAASLTEFRPVN